jgi:TfoX/Sxy family transcriptional regulator of competence genes
MPAKWKSSPPALVERFAGALPAHPDVTRRPMFGFPCAFVRGNLACGLFEDNVLVRVGAEAAAQLITAGAAPFTPMPDRTMKDYVLVPHADAAHAAKLSAWLTRALDYTLTLPAKAPRTAVKKTAAKTAPAKNPAAKRSTSRRRTP